MADHTNPAPSIVTQGTDFGSGTSVTFTLPLTGVEVDDLILLHVIWRWANPLTPTPTITADAGWVERDNSGVNGGGGNVDQALWTAFYDGSMTDVTFTLGTACDEGLAVFDVIDAHATHGITTPQFDSQGSPNHTASPDRRYWEGYVLQPHPPARIRIFAALGGANDNAGDLGPVDGPPSDGYGDFHGLEFGEAKLYVCSKPTGLADLDPVALGTGSPTISGIGAWQFQTPDGKGWQWDAAGSPENNELMNGSPPANQLYFMMTSQMNSFHYHDFFVEVEEDVPYWGILSTPSS